MGLESATFISQLVNTNPIGTDDRSTADDHMRLIKAVLQSTFTNATAAITPTPTEFNILDGAVVTTAELNRLQSYVGTANRALISDGSGNIIVSPGVTTTELNLLDGLVSSTAELNRLQSYIGTANRALVSDGSGNIIASTTVTTTELASLNGILASSTELNLMDGCLASTAELNTMNGILSTTAELNRLQSFVGTASRAVVTNGSGNLVVSAVTTTELNRLDGMTASATELNKLDGATVTTAQLNFVTGVTSSIQTQINGKAPTAHSHTGGEISALDVLDITSGTFALSFIPTINQAKLGSNAVGQAELNSANAEGSTASTSKVLITLAGGQWGFYPRTRETGDGMDAQISDNNTQQGSTYGSFVAISARTTGTVFIEQTYIQASPPYDLGDGEIPLFIFVEIQTDGKIISVYSAPEAPWHNNGPTSIRADGISGDGKPFKLITDPDEVNAGMIAAGHPPGLTKAAAKARSPQAFSDYIEAVAAAGTIEVEITQAIKQADMPLLPAPMILNTVVRPEDTREITNTLVLLDPVAPLTLTLFEAIERGEFSVNELLHDGDLIVDNTALPRSGPPGVDVVSYRFR